MRQRLRRRRRNRKLRLIRLQKIVERLAADLETTRDKMKKEEALEDILG